LLSLSTALETQNLVSAQLNHITDARNSADARDWIETQRRLRPMSFAGVRGASDRGLRHRHDETARALAEEINTELGEVERFLSTDGERLALLFDALQRGDREAAESARASLIQHEVAGAARLRELGHKVERAMDELTQGALARERRALWLLVILASSTIGLGAAMALYTRRVLSPLARVTARAKVVAAGDLTPREVKPSADEIGELAVTFEAMVAAIARARHELVQAERLAAVGRMAAHVTHEIRNPISAMGLNVEMLQEELAGIADADEARQLVAAVGAEIDRLAALSQQYLKLARRQQPEFEPLDVGTLINEIVRFVQAELDRAEITVHVDIAANLPDVLADDAQLRQALINLIRNAREAMPNGGVLRVEAAMISKTKIELLVIDSGEGIPEASRASLFDPFFTTKKQGTGLGLAITREIVEAHGGAISCESATPHGTVFRVTLPIEPPPTSQRPNP
jgi:signal transduction histidine kinase